MKSINFSLLLLSILLSSCVLLQESSNKKNLESIEYEITYQPESDPNIISSSAKINKPSSTQEIAYPNEIWYHPNPWWRIKTAIFPISKDSFQIRRYAPQYGFSNYIDPISKTKSDGWKVWLSQNYWDGYGNAVTHAWNGFISTHKEVLKKHPEYLAEKDGVRLGYGKTSKLCVSNKDLQELYIQHVKNTIKRFPDRTIYSVEPSDGGGLCTCVNCAKIGSINDQPFYLANQIAKAIKISHPGKQVGLYAYFQHSEVPDFKLEENVQVVVIPQGFQTLYSPIGLLSSWSKSHNNLGMYEYFGIPQRTADLPYIYTPYFLSNLYFAQDNQFNTIIYESAANLNAITIGSMISKLLMNPALTWESVFNKFLEDCFQNSKVPIERLLKRWHTYNTPNKEEIHYALYDINEADKLTQDRDELQRIRDLKTYLLYQIQYFEWNIDRNDLKRTAVYFDFIYRIAHRNILNTKALSSVYAKYYNKDLSLNKKYSYHQRKDWVQYYTDDEIDQAFEKALKKYTPQKNEYISLGEIQKAIQKDNSIQFLKEISLPVRARSLNRLYSNSTEITVIPKYTSSDKKAIISIYDYSGKFIQQKLLNSGESWSVQLPDKGIYIISQHRVPNIVVDIKGEFALLQSKPAQKGLLDIRMINSKEEIIKADGKEEILKSEPYFIISELPKKN